MLLPAFYLLTAAVLLGMYLSLFYLGILPRRSWIAGAIHGLLAAAGLALLFLSLGGPERGVEHGVQSFGAIAAAIASAALVIGLGFVALQLFAKKRVAWLIGAHATVALTAYLFLMAYIALG